MKKIFLILIIICIFLNLTIISAGNNTTEVTSPTYHIETSNTITALEGGDSNITFSDGYKGYCIEWGEHSAEAGEKFYIKNTSYAINTETSEDISNYLKIFFVYFYNETQKDPIQTQHMIWKFTNNKQFSRFNQTLYNQIIEKARFISVPDSGTIQYNSTHKMFFDFKVFLAQVYEWQNYFGYSIYFQENLKEENNQIIQNLTNNTAPLPENVFFNKSKIKFNEKTINKYKKNFFKSTLNNRDSIKKHFLGEYKCGTPPQWLFFWIICLSICTLLLRRE